MGTEIDVEFDQERISKIKLASLAHIDEARELCEELYVLTYIPKEFKLESLTVERQGTGVISLTEYHDAMEVYTEDCAMMVTGKIERAEMINLAIKICQRRGL